MKTTTEVATKPAAGEQAITTNLTIDWEGVSEEDLRALAQQALIVKLQSGWRKNTIPAGEFEVKAADHKVGARAPRTKLTPEQMVAALSVEDKAALLAKLQAMLAK